jgi:hypothetical protein
MRGSVAKPGLDVFKTPGREPVARSRAKYALAALAFGLVVPSQVIVPIDIAKITATRAILLILFFPALLSYMRGLGARSRRVRPSDIFAVLMCFWIFFALTVTEGIAVSAESGGLVVLEFIGGYLVMRGFVRTRSDVEAFVICIYLAVFFLVLVALFDSLMGQNFVTDTLGRWTGQPTNETQYRNGLVRARSMLDHPILFGTLCSFAAVILFYGLRSMASRFMGLALCTLGVLLTVSSAPLLALLLAIGIMVYDRLFRTVPSRWRLLLWSIAAVILLLVIVRDDPVRTLIRHLTLDPQTAYYRLLIWDYAGAEALNSPLVGIGHREWARLDWMSGSVDTIWLSLALTFGIPCSLLLGGTLLASMRQPGPQVPAGCVDPYLVGMRQALSMVLCLAITIGFTVHLWGVMWTLLGSLAGLRMTLGEMCAAEAESFLSRRKLGAKPVPRGMIRRVGNMARPHYGAVPQPLGRSTVTAHSRPDWQ